jgi:DNA-binding NarL/FixJ family response regulator
MRQHAADSRPKDPLLRPISDLPAQTSDPEHAGPTPVLVGLEPIRVVIVDAQPVVRAGFAAMLRSEGDMEVTGMAADADEAVAVISALRPEVALLALDLPGTGGLEAARRIRGDAGCAGTNLIVLSASDGDDDLFEALRAGACGFLPKSAQQSELMQAVRVVAGGEAFLLPRETRRLIGELRTQPRPRTPRPGQLEELTEREREVMALVAVGMRNDEIAEHLVISPATVKTHVSRALRKLDAHDRSQLVAIAYQRGIVGGGAGGRLRALPAPAPPLTVVRGAAAVG